MQRKERQWRERAIDRMVERQINVETGRHSHKHTKREWEREKGGRTEFYIVYLLEILAQAMDMRI